MAFRVPDLIVKKRNGGTLNAEEIEFFIRGVVKREVQDAQLGAMLMAMFLRDLNNDETSALTGAMKNSGEVLSWPPEWKGLVVDKHSTGGVGDKVSLVLAPALAACGMKVPMVSGRGLVHTGGTLDKLESIPGFQVSVTTTKMTEIIDRVGCCIVGQTENLVPADKIMYSTRDVTGTTDHIGLITASIVSKKAAETLDALVLDVKCGKGAFLQTREAATCLARRMVDCGNAMGMKTVALLTNMDSPLGRMVGNALEVKESLRCLHGGGPEDLISITLELGGQLLLNTGKVNTVEDGRLLIKEKLSDGSALECFRSMMKCQGVDNAIADALCSNDFSSLPAAKHVTVLRSSSSGRVKEIDAMVCAMESGKLGAGRTKAGEQINHAVGLEFLVGIGDNIEKDQPWLKVHHDNDVLADDIINNLQGALLIESGGNNSRLLEVIE